MICLKSQRELETMDKANRLVHRVLRAVEEAAAPGVSTGELDKLAEGMIRAEGGTPAFKGYRGFPATLCTSINDVIVHGIPNGKNRLKDGDLVSVDCGVLLDGYYGDAAVTFGKTPFRPCGRTDDWGTLARRCRSAPRRPATAWSASSSATASVDPCTKSRRCPTMGRRATVSGSNRASLLRSSQ